VRTAFKRPWPSDAVIIVCASPEDANRSNMSSIQSGKCRDCGDDILVDGKSIDSGMRMNERCGRPVEFLCVDCAVEYDMHTIEKLVDHRKKSGT
jgi:hypothetical protein